MRLVIHIDNYSLDYTLVLRITQSIYTYNLRQILNSNIGFRSS